MFMRIVWAKVRPGAWAQHEARYKSLNEPAEGLRSRWLVQDTNDPDAMFVVGLWESLDAIKNWEASDYYRKTYAPALRPFLEGGWTVSVCEVLHDEQM